MKPIIIRVTKTVDYLIEVTDDGKHTNINGWSVDEVINDWFKNPRYPLGIRHAARDANQVGNSVKIISTEVKDVQDVISSM